MPKFLITRERCALHHAIVEAVDEDAAWRMAAIFNFENRHDTGSYWGDPQVQEEMDDDCVAEYAEDPALCTPEEEGEK